MQIADYLGQYANSLANAPSADPKANTAKSAATQNLVSTLTDMQEGTVFEGSINSIDGSKILLGLGNGQTVTARLDGSIHLALGQSVFFQVKSNDGSMVAIKPFAGGQAFNPTIQKALDAAGMEMTKDTIDMVNRMMQEGMPIDKNSLAAMRQALVQNPNIPMHMAITMSRLGIPVNDQMAAQFENYQNGRHAVLGQMEEVMDALPGVFSKVSGGASDILQMNQQILSILNVEEGVPQGQEAPVLFLDGAGQQEEAALRQEQISGQEAATGQVSGQEAGAGQVSGQEAGAGQVSGQEAGTGQANGQEAAGLKPGGQGAGIQQPGGQIAGIQQPGGQEAAALQAQKEAGSKAGSMQQDGQAVKDWEGRPGTGPSQIADLLNRHQAAQLEAQLKEVFQKEGDFKLNTQLTAKEFLDALAKQFRADEGQAFGKEALSKLFSGKEYHALLKEAMKEQWMVRPEELKDAHKMEQLYQRLERQMGQIEQLARHAGMDTGQLQQSAAQVRGNIEFMNQINQAYTYVQIPLKMANQNAHSDLYVYTNKRSLRKKEGELSAFLHLELENLGSTDVSVKMLDKNVSTKFYLEDDEAYSLVEAHLPKLQERLAKLGYNCKVTIENREEKVDFVKDFLQKSQPSKSAAKGMVHRYSFDVRA